MTAGVLVDTNVLVYRHDPRSPAKQEQAWKTYRAGVAGDRIRIPNQALIEFFAAVTRPLRGGAPLLDPDAARREVEEMLLQVPVLYPTEHVLHTALRGAAAYGFSWFDAHLWAYAESFGLAELYSEDFEHDRLYGTVRVINPFRDVE